MNGRTFAGFLLAGAIVVGASEQAAEGQTLKLATLAPQGSIWDRTLRTMGDTWRVSPSPSPA